MDWDARTLRVVHFVVRSKGGVRIRKVLSVAIPPDLRGGDPVAVGQLIRQVLDRERIAAGRMVVDVPRDQAVLNTLKLPAVSDDELPAMVEFQVSKELPFPLTVAAVDFAVENGDDGAGFREVLVAAVRKEVLEFYAQVAQAAGLKLERVGLRPYANREAINELLGDTRRERVLFVDVGPVLTEIDVLRDGRLAFSRAASVAVPVALEPESPADTKADGKSSQFELRLMSAVAASPPRLPPEWEGVVQSLVVEVARTVEAYRAGDPGASMDHVVVGGDTGVEGELLEALKRRLSITGERYNPGACFGWGADSGMAAGGFAAALGLALGHAGEGRLDFDFAHPKRAVTKTQRRLNKAPLAAAVLLTFLLSGAVGYTRYVGPKKAEIERWQTLVDEADERVKQYKKFEEMIAKVEEFEREQIVWVDELHDFLTAFPGNDQIVITELDMDQKSASFQVKLECKGRPIVDEALSRVDEYPADSAPKRFDARVKGSTTDVPGAEYSVRAAMEISLINRNKSADGAKGAGGSP